MSLMSLDQRFGKLLTPQLPASLVQALRSQGLSLPKAYKDWEKWYQPKSLCKLDDSGSAILQNFMEHVVDEWQFGRTVCDDVLIIWLIDAQGELWYAIEEIVIDGQPISRPRQSSTLASIEYTANVDKLGHPSIVRCRTARIGGEIRLAKISDGEIVQWEINNKSGRYGIHPSRTREHLENAMALFHDRGFILTPKFIEYRNP